MSIPEFSLEERVYNRTAELIAVAKAVHEVCGGTRKAFMNPRDLSDSVRIVTNCAAAIPGSYVVIVGGMAVQELGWERFTKDIDVVADNDHFGALLQSLRDAGFELTTLHVLKHRQSGIEVDLSREGTTLKTARLPLPHPRELGPNRGFATFEGLLRLKLDAGRMQDQADVVKLMIPRLADAEGFRVALPEVLRSEFDRLVLQARREAT